MSETLRTLGSRRDDLNRRRFCRSFVRAIAIGCGAAGAVSLAGGCEQREISRRQISPGFGASTPKFRRTR